MDINSFVIGFKKGKASVPSGGGSSGGVELNIAYGDTAPEDTTKLWVKTTQPSGVMVSDVMETVEVSGNSFVASAGHSQSHMGGGVGVIDGKIYLLGGGICLAQSGGKYTTEIVCYDPQTEVFTTLPEKMPAARYYLASEAVGKKIYTFGGSYFSGGVIRYTSTIYCFDAESQKVSTLSATLPETNAGHGIGLTTAAVGTNILLFGANRSTLTNLIYCFDTITETITTLPFTMPGTVNKGAAVSDGKFAYFTGGSIDSVAFKGILRIDIENQTVTDLGVTLASTPTDGTAEYLNGKLCIWGKTGSDYTIDVVDIERGLVESLKISDMIGNNWQFLYACITTCGDTIYLFDGNKNNNTSATSNRIADVYKFKLAVTKVLLDKDTLQLKPTLDKNKFSLIGSESLSIAIGVDSAFKGNENNEAEPVEAALYKDGAWTTI